MKKSLLLLLVISLGLLSMSCEEVVPSESESNNTFATANAISLNVNYSAQITLEDIDHFSFTVPAGKRYRVTLEWISGDLDLYAGAVIYSDGVWEIAGYIDDGDAAENETFTISNPSSTDQEWVVGVLDYWNTGTGAYSIILTDDGTATGGKGISVADSTLLIQPENAIIAPAVVK